MKLYKLFIIWSLIGLLTTTSCEKFVDIQPKGQLTPSTVEDFQMLMDVVQHMNFSGTIATLASDELKLQDLDFQKLGNAYEKNSYVWEKEIYREEDVAADWNIPYVRVYNANIVLEGLQTTKTGSQLERDNVKGQALFHRSSAFFELAQLFAKKYSSSSAATDLGIPLRTSSNVMEVSTRPTLQQTYDFILSDLLEALTLLPSKGLKSTRASKVSTHALLARVYLSMDKYAESLAHALEALKIQPDLLNFNELSPFQWPRFKELNKETIFFETAPFNGYSFQMLINKDLYDQYEENDLRKSLFFNSYVNTTNNLLTINLGGHYGGSFGRFTGIATDEIYLIAAECYARTNNLDEAQNYINHLLRTRYATNKYVAFKSDNQDKTLLKIIQERNKELIGRNRRWFDLKRLTTDPKFAITLQRTVQGKTYTLLPNSDRYVYPIPTTVINASGIKQNTR